MLDVEGFKDRFNVKNPHFYITVNVPSTIFIVDMGWLLKIESGTMVDADMEMRYAIEDIPFMSDCNMHDTLSVQNNKRTKTKENTPFKYRQNNRW